MGKSGRVPLLVIDAAGAAIVAVCVLVSVWLTAVRPDGAKSEITGLTRLIQAAQKDLIDQRAACDHQRAVLADRSAELAESGHLPEQTPLEEYFRTLSDLAARHQLRVVRQNPLSSRRYPGLLEQRFAYEKTGSTPDLVHFFKAIETIDFWADISYLKVESGQSPYGRTPSDRVATLTLSLFSVLPSNGSASDG